MQDPCPNLSPRPRCAGTFATMAAKAVMATAALVSLLGLLSTPAWASSAVTDQCATWEKIPAGTFKSEGTGVPCVLLTMKK